MRKIAAIQMCSSDKVDDNLAQAAILIEKAAASGALLAVLPEMFAHLGLGNTDKIILREHPGAGKIQDFLADLALKHKIWIVGGTIPLSTTHPQKIKAACLVFDDQGHQVARYDKMHLFDASLSQQETYRESATTVAGDKIAVVSTPVGRLGLCVCFDIRFPGLFADMNAQGAEVIAIPAAFTKKTGQAHWELLARCRALDSFSYIVGACQGGVHPNARVTHGHSMIVNPWGTIIAELQDPGSGIAMADINLKTLYEIRAQITLA